VPDFEALIFALAARLVFTQDTGSGKIRAWQPGVQKA
jgi:hypothetical protein